MPVSPLNSNATIQQPLNPDNTTCAGAKQINVFTLICQKTGLACLAEKISRCSSFIFQKCFPTATSFLNSWQNFESSRVQVLKSIDSTQLELDSVEPRLKGLNDEIPILQAKFEAVDMVPSEDILRNSSPYLTNEIAEYRKLEASLLELNRKIIEQENKKAELNKKHNEIIDEIKGIKEELTEYNVFGNTNLIIIANLNKNISECEKKLAELNNEIASTREKVSKLNTWLESTIKVILPGEQVLTEEEVKHKLEELNQTNLSLQNEYRSIEEKLKKANKMKDQFTETTLVKLGEAIKAKNQEFENHLKPEFDIIDRELAQLGRDKSDCNKKIGSFFRNLEDTLSVQLKEKEDQLKNGDSNIAKLNQTLKSLKDESSHCLESSQKLSEEFKQMSVLSKVYLLFRHAIWA